MGIMRVGPLPWAEIESVEKLDWGLRWVVMCQMMHPQWYNNNDNGVAIIVIYGANYCVPVHSHGWRLEVGLRAY